ncbi:MAG: sensor domain-containing phosphodiesterase [Actinomycetota bacterium]
MSQLEVLAAVDDAVDPTTLMQRVCDRTLELIEAAEGVAIGLLADRSITYVCAGGSGASPIGATVGLGASLSGLAIVTGEIQRSDDTQRDPRVDAEACRRLGVASLLCIPLVRAREVFGVLAVNASSTHAFDANDVAVLARLADFVSVAVGTACDLHRASRQLIDLNERGERSPSLAADPDTADETAGRYVMGVLSPETVTRIDARRRVQQVLDDPSLLSTVFQPIVDLASGEVTAVEALARFNAVPARSPDVWFSEAHLAGLGIELELLAIRRALEEHPRLPDGVAMTINAGPDTIVAPRLLPMLVGAASRGLVIELTEHTAFDRFPGLPVALMALRKGGVRLAVDDAGSGYSSLTHILRLAPDFIKLDRELIAGIDLDPVRRALVTSLVVFASETGARILAEGVETDDELEAVQRLGVRYAQGYYLGRPAPLDELDLSRSGTRSSPITGGV